MTAYVETSALLRLALREPGAIDNLFSADSLVASEIIVVESKRAIDRLRLLGVLGADEAAGCGRLVTDWLEAVDLVLIRPPVLNRASEPLPTPLGTLDALHLATALVWRERVGPVDFVATHDSALGLAARAFGLDVRGV